eukprot:4742172-Pleurochrysis_carterae.AAC.1
MAPELPAKLAVEAPPSELIGEQPVTRPTARKGRKRSRRPLPRGGEAEAERLGEVDEPAERPQGDVGIATLFAPGVYSGRVQA